MALWLECHEVTLPDASNRFLRAIIVRVQAHGFFFTGRIGVLFVSLFAEPLGLSIFSLSALLNPEHVADDDAISAVRPVLWQQLVLPTALRLSGGLQLPEHVAVAVFLVVLLRVDDDVHPVALVVDLSGRDEVRADRMILRQVGREVHLLPLEPLPEVVRAGKSELAQMPALDEVYLAVYQKDELLKALTFRLVVHAVWMLLVRHCHHSREG